MAKQKSKSSKAKVAEVADEEEEYATHLVYKSGPITINGNNNTVKVYMQGEPPDPDPPSNTGP